jgi:hypothetical protein
MLILALTFPLGYEVTLLFPLINRGFEENQALTKEKFMKK